ncbi:wings apart-like protein [Marchantia polymorpha subsp. ruderalis]|uniref:Wings apart-like protein C-terminal domain-containing protein n=2 Tax=Marchantia polymorpha TaxID=3197 RepID=A0A176VDF1_MARPO|nr:hypothetical protein AXG93_3426s1050 [Marchantia polymorpha subsp. ruderalis]PTQ45567.1 hypothetical protein MARPO_0014s0099 [Marchantia polymorpha]BBM98158.1 hypothetical protein Mp_1g11280 [Marchantia polymorpha subsp. ruderalis]|eukprot:PTQ45567.1 hypothetical protein MARPO_0014s0099 [Marchantia polymorpha]
MIVRTYQRRNRPSRSLSEGGNAFGDGVGSSGSQESIWGGAQEPQPFSFPSSQESCWSQSDHRSTSRLPLNSRRFSQDDDLSADALSSLGSRPPLSRSYSERPKKGDEGKPSRSKLKKSQSDLPGSLISETRNGFSRGAERRRSSDLHGKDSQENGGGSSSGKRESVWVDALNNTSAWGLSAPPTSTLMEAQESGEMMEHVDEANFALDGLKPEQPLRVQRASLTSLLTLCGSMHQRRLLRTQGMAKPLVDAIVALPTDDAALSLAAAAVLYFLASDSQDEDLLDSPSCVRFLMKLLGTRPSEPVVKKGLTAIGSRLAALSKSSLLKSNTTFSADRGGGAVVTKIRALFKSLPEHGAGLGNTSEENGMLPGEEINSKWLALLTLEKACLSTVVLEDSTAETVRKVGGQFKERLRELGGLDAVCELAAGCLVNVTEALKLKDAETLKHVDLVALERSEKSGGVGVLLRCLRVMENVTFLSEQNQKHLLELKLPKGKANEGESFIGLTMNVINTLSELSQRQKQTQNVDPSSYPHCDGSGIGKEISHLSQKSEGIESSTVCKGSMQTLDADLCETKDTPPWQEHKEDTQRSEPSALGKSTSSVITFQRRKSLKAHSSLQVLDDSEKSQETSLLSVDSLLGEQSREPPTVGSVDRSSEKVSKIFYKRKASHVKSELHHKSTSGTEEVEISVQSDVGVESKACKIRHGGNSLHEDSQDPFSFDDIESKMKGDLKKKTFEDSQDPFTLDDIDLDLKDTKKKPKRAQPAKSVAQSKKRGPLISATIENKGAVKATVVAEVLDEKNTTLKSPVEEENSKQEAVIGDCLLSGVKVLMNLTNNNPVGCRQVAAFGGLKTLSSLLIAHYPWPKAPVLLPDCKDVPTGDEAQGVITKESDHDLDIVVTVLGVLCNLVEKDTCNRTRLASLMLQVPPSIARTKEGELWQEEGMVALLCSLFLTKQGAGEAAEAENKRVMEIDEEASFKQGQAEAEDMIVEAYTALLLGFLSKESERSRTAIAQLLPEDGLKVLVPVLERFVAFHLSLNMLAPETHAVVRDVIDSCKQPLANHPAV